MKAWPAYLDRANKSDLWGFVVLDWYYRRPRDHKENANQFLRRVLPRVVKSHPDPVAFHRVLVCVCVQLLGSDFKTIIDLSLFCLKQLSRRPDPVQVSQMIEHYAPYGEAQNFMSSLRSRKIAFDSSSEDKLQRQIVSAKGTLPETRTAGADELGEKINMADLNDCVLKALQRAAIDPARDSPGAGEDYLKSFRISGTMKGEAFKDVLEKYPIFNSDRIAIVSVGGADGTEISYILRNSKMRYGILLEKDPAAFDYATLKRGELANLAKTLVLFPGDAKETIKSCNKRLQQWKAEKLIDGVAYSINATLHELPSRGPQKFDLRSFMYQVVGTWSPFLIVMREPCSAKDWPSNVELMCPYLPQRTLELLATSVADKLKMRVPAKIKVMSDEYVQVPARLAVEVLFKLFYIKDYEYEVQESVTSIPSQKLREALNETLKKGKLETAYSNSPSFDKLYDQYEIHCRDSKLVPKPKPTVFVSLVGTRT